MRRTGISYWALLAAALGGGAISYFILHTGKAAGTTPIATAPDPSPAAAPICDYTNARARGYRMVRPLLSSEPQCESPRYAPLRDAVGQLLREWQKSGKVDSASVYMRDFKKGEWTCYNGLERYDPGSLLKVPLLVTYLAMLEEDDKLPLRKYACEGGDPAGRNAPFGQALSEVQRTYTVDQLLELMIVSSDDRAMATLQRHALESRYLRTFTNLGLPTPTGMTSAYTTNVLEYSVFMKVLYNSAYISPTHSDKAMEMLTRTGFDKGLVAGVPQGTKVAHEFGGWSDTKECQLHETGLVLAPNNTYLITVMSKGKNVNDLAEFISAVSKLVYERMTTAPLAQGLGS